MIADWWCRCLQRRMSYSCHVVLRYIVVHHPPSEPSIWTTHTKIDAKKYNAADFTLSMWSKVQNLKNLLQTWISQGPHVPCFSGIYKVQKIALKKWHFRAQRKTHQLQYFFPKLFNFWHMLLQKIHPAHLAGVCWISTVRAHDQSAKAITSDTTCCVFVAKKCLHEVVLVPCHLLTFCKISLTNLWALKFVCCSRCWRNNFDCSTLAIPLVQSFPSWSHHLSGEPLIISFNLSPQ